MNDPKAKDVNGKKSQLYSEKPIFLYVDIADVEVHFPGLLTEIREWYRDYRVVDGKEPNRYGFGGRPLDRVYSFPPLCC